MVNLFIFIQILIIAMASSKQKLEFILYACVYPPSAAAVYAPKMYYSLYTLVRTLPQHDNGHARVGEQ